MISIHQISKQFGSLMAVKNLSMQINSGEIVALVGPSGCGKSTMLRMINRLIEPSDGYLKIDGQNVHDFAVEKLRRSIGYIIQNHGLFPHWTVAQNIATVPRLLRWEQSRIAARIWELLEMFELDAKEYAHKKPHQLSGGQQQRVGVARALAANPNIMLMDEPFGALDPITRVSIQDAFLKIQKHIHKTVILVTHDMDEAFKMADKIAIMRQGELIQYADAETLLLSPKNTFVSNMLGSSDKAWRYLSRRKVSAHMQSTKAICEVDLSKEAIEEKANQQQNRIWVTDHHQRPVGYYSPDPRTEGLIKVPKELWLKGDMTLKEALNVMVWAANISSLPVVDDNLAYMGDISFSNFSPFAGQ